MVTLASKDFFLQKFKTAGRYSLFYLEKILNQFCTQSVTFQNISKNIRELWDSKKDSPYNIVGEIYTNFDIPN